MNKINVKNDTYGSGSYQCKYDKNNRLKEIIDANGSKKLYKWKGSKCVKDASRSYTYDKKGNLQKSKASYGSLKSKNYYKGSKLVKRYYSSGYSYDYYVVYSYKTISIPKSLKKMVKAQQWALLNDNLNMALGVTP